MPPARAALTGAVVDVDALLAGLGLDRPLEAAKAPPAAAYISPEVAAREVATLFRRRWLCVGRTDAVAAPGTWVAGEAAGVPWVVTRGDDGVLRGFVAVCRHRATVVCEGSGAGLLRCPYHGWVYGLDGRLRATPRAPWIDKDAHGLVPLAVGTWRRWLFVHLGEPTKALADVLAPLDGALDDAGLVHVSTRTYAVAASWKVYVDNYLDGGYHVPVAHPSLAGELRLGSYRTEVHGDVVLQRCCGKGGRVGDDALYAWVHPTWMLNRYGDVLDTNLVIPRGPDRCEVVFDHFTTPDVAADSARVAAIVAASDAVQAEDDVLCARVQRGLASGAWTPGPYAEPEVGALHFHRLWAGDLG